MSRVRLAGALLMFLLLAGLAVTSLPHRLDLAVTLWVQRAAPVADWPAAILVFLGNAEILIPGSAAIGALIWARDRRRGLAALWLAAGLVATSGVAVVLKHLIVHPGPPESLGRHLPLALGLRLHETPFSFPSGHTMRTTFLAGTLLYRVPVLAGIVLVSMMAALIYLGDHWATDVVGGLCLGWASVELARRMKGLAA